jgi:hypothetical protein
MHQQCGERSPTVGKTLQGYNVILVILISVSSVALRIQTEVNYKPG